jgi:hypothetical protein
MAKCKELKANMNYLYSQFVYIAYYLKYHISGTQNTDFQTNLPSSSYKTHYSYWLNASVSSFTLYKQEEKEHLLEQK